MVYQERNDMSNNKMIVYDIERKEIVQSIDINLNKNCQNFVYEDNVGFNCFKILRSGELEDNTES